jgi:RES domain-containing protein
MPGEMDHENLRDLTQPFAGEAWCHAPAGEPFRVAALGRDDDGRDRWSVPGVRTVYLAGDRMVAVGEYARHGRAAEDADARCLVRLLVSGLNILDVRRPEVAKLLDLGDDVLDRAATRAAADRARAAGVSEGLIVPSIAFLDDPARFNVVVFCEALDAPIEQQLRDATVLGEIRIEATSSPDTP